ncbi:GTPase [Nannocystis pusilla]|uniref:GTPase n=1 Tax=Nannocystis pusilla TaxID=889268 RepID=UPI003B7C1EFF
MVIAGPPNAGKSALFNALLGRSRAIVSPTPGTTRDYVEAELQIDGLEVVVVDTAGLRGGTDDAIEHEGIGRSREQIAGAELVLWLEPADAEPTDARPSGALRVESKRDLGIRRSDWHGVSAQSGEGLDNCARRSPGRCGETRRRRGSGWRVTAIERPRRPRR